MRKKPTPESFRLVVLVALALSICAGAMLTTGCSSRNVDPTSAAAGQVSAQTVERGKALRQAIDAEYERRRRVHQIDPMGENSIVEVIRPFIHAGTNFEEAEQTLWAAGFVVRPRSKSLISPRLEVVAKIAAYDTVWFGLGGRTSVYVFLEPVTEDDWRTVGRVDAGFVESFL